MTDMRTSVRIQNPAYSHSFFLVGFSIFKLVSQSEKPDTGRVLYSWEPRKTRNVKEDAHRKKNVMTLLIAGLAFASTTVMAGKVKDNCGGRIRPTPSTCMGIAGVAKSVFLF